jgi:drug/metabolite transporter (DMT)-like permease
MDRSAPFFFAGPLACLSAAFLWAVAISMFRRPVSRHGARAVNLVKCLLAAVLQGLTVWSLGRMGDLAEAPVRSLILTAASGLVGLTLGDTALFGSLARIGVHRTLLLQTLAPVFTALLAATWQGERLSGTQAAAGLVILGGIALVVMPRRAAGAGAATAPPPRGDGAGGRLVLAGGVAFGVLAAFGQGCGVVLAKAGMNELPVLGASFLRLGVAALGLALLELTTGRLGRLRRMLRDGPALARAVPATILGTYLALFLMMAGVALAPASVAAVLLSTSPVFSLLLEAIVERRPIRPRALLGTLLAVAGVALLTAV